MECAKEFSSRLELRWFPVQKYISVRNLIERNLSHTHPFVKKIKDGDDDSYYYYLFCDWYQSDTSPGSFGFNFFINKDFSPNCFPEISGLTCYSTNNKFFWHVEWRVSNFAIVLAFCTVQYQFLIRDDSTRTPHFTNMDCRYPSRDLFGISKP